MPDEQPPIQSEISLIFFWSKRKTFDANLYFIHILIKIKIDDERMAWQNLLGKK